MAKYSNFCFLSHDNDGCTYNGVREKYRSDVNFSLDTLFGNGSLSTTDYHVVRTLSNGLNVEYYLTYSKELYDENSWCVKIMLPFEVRDRLKKIGDACHWTMLFTEDSIKRVFINYPHILNAVILRDKDCSIDIMDFSNLSVFIHVDNLSEYREKVAVEGLVDEAFAIIKELSHFRINTDSLVRKPQEANKNIVLPSWLKTGINGVLKIGARALSSYIGSNVDANFDVGNIDVGNVDIGNIDIGNLDFGVEGFDVGDIYVDSVGFDSGDFDGGDYRTDGFDSGDFAGEASGLDSGAIDSDLESPENNLYYDGVTFKAKDFSGFIDKDKTISVHSMGGGPSYNLHVYVKNGTNTICVSDGSCSPVPVIGHNWISVGGHNFKVSDIKCKI